MASFGARPTALVGLPQRHADRPDYCSDAAVAVAVAPDSRVSAAMAPVELGGSYAVERFLQVASVSAQAATVRPLKVRSFGQIAACRPDRPGCRESAR